MIALRNEFSAFSRRADAKISLLKEVIERIQNGEEVDVEGLLGTGDKEREKEWEEGRSAGLTPVRSSNDCPVLQEIEREDQAWEQSRRTKPKHGNRNIGKEPSTKTHTEFDSTSKTGPRTNAPSGFF